MSKEINTCEDCRRNCDEPCWKVEHGLLVEVVQCKDCAFKQYWFKHDCGAAICGVSGLRCAEETDFCSYGERKNDE